MAPYNPHHHPAGHGASHSSRVAMQAGVRAARQANNWALKMSRRAAAAGFRMTRLAAMNARKAEHQKQQARVDALRRSLSDGISQPLDVSEVRYLRGAALFLPSNWTGADGSHRVVLWCNTAIPDTGRPAAALLWRGADIAFVDLQAHSTVEYLKRGGRLFVFPVSARFRNGDAYSILPAGYQRLPGGPPGYWGFSNVASLKGRAFRIDSNGLGTFEDPNLGHILLARPNSYDKQQRCWLWAGRLKEAEPGQAVLRVGSSSSRGVGDSQTFTVPTVAPNSGIVVFKCVRQDDLGDPIALVDTRPAGRIVRLGNVLHLAARPNQVDGKGQPLFAERAMPGADGEKVVAFPFSDGGDHVTVELAANHRRPDGSHWFARYPNVREKGTGTPLVLLALRRVEAR